METAQFGIFVMEDHRLNLYFTYLSIFLSSADSVSFSWCWQCQCELVLQPGVY